MVPTDCALLTPTLCRKRARTTIWKRIFSPKKELSLSIVLKYQERFIGHLATAAGTAYDYDFFHTFQNRRCYEFAFIMGLENAGSYDLDCMIAIASGDDLEALI